MKRNILRALACLLAILIFAASTFPAVLSVSAADEIVYLGDRQDLFIKRESLDEFGWNTAHSGEPITIGSARFDKGIGFHCLPDQNAYAEFDISSLGMNYFSAYVGVLQEASYFLEWGSISFHVYGDGKLLTSSPVRNWGDEPYFLSCSVEGVSTLRLEQNNENGHACDAGVWGNICLTMEAVNEETTEGGETILDPDKTTLTQPSELVSGDYAYVSDLYWIDNKTYPGNVVGRDCNTANEIIISADFKFFEKGVGFHGTSSDYTSYVDVNIEGLGFTRFAAYYGVSETLSPHDISMALVKFAVFGDGVKLWESDTMKYGEDMKAMDCDITGVKTLRIAMAGAPDISGAWGTYGGAVLSKSGEITDNMLYSDLTFETESDINEPETNEPMTAPVTDSETAPATEQDTTETMPESEIQPQKNGCGSVIGSASGGIALAVCAAVALTKKKED